MFPGGSKGKRGKERDNEVRNKLDESFPVRKLLLPGLALVSYIGPKTIQAVVKSYFMFRKIFHQTPL